METGFSARMQVHSGSGNTGLNQPQGFTGSKHSLHFQHTVTVSKQQRVNGGGNLFKDVSTSASAHAHRHTLSYMVSARRNLALLYCLLKGWPCSLLIVAVAINKKIRAVPPATLVIRISKSSVGPTKIGIAWLVCCLVSCEIPCYLQTRMTCQWMKYV